MKIEDKPNGRTRYSELTPQQFEAGMDFLHEVPVSYEWHEDHPNWIALVAATSEQKAAFEDALT